MLPGVLALVSNIATNTISLPDEWVAASWVAVGLLLTASIVVEVRRSQPTGVRIARVRDLNDPVAVGVHRAAPSSRSPLPPFVPRDRFPDVRDALQAGGFVLIVGDSTAGKTRLAYEAMRQYLPRHTCVRPLTPEALPDALRIARRKRHAVVWLDDLERYLGSPPVDWDGVLVLATIRTHERDDLSTRHDPQRSPGDRQRARAGRAVFDAVTHEIRLDRMWSDDEVARARTVDDDRIAQALAGTSRHGVAETIAAGPQLLQSWRDARDARGAAIVSAAVDARLAGHHRPLSEDLLRELHLAYVPETERPGPWGSALEWATQPVQATSSMLEPVGSGYLAFDYLVDATAAEPFTIPTATWQILIDHVEGADLVEVGWQASFHGQLDLVERAARRLLDADEHTAASSVAAALGDAGRSERAAELLEEILDRAEQSSSLDSVVRLGLLEALVWETGEKYAGLGDPASALPLARRLVAEHTALSGPTHRATLFARLGLARQLGGTDEVEEALATATDVVEQSRRLFGEDDSLTLSARFEVCVWSRAVHGEKAGAEQFADLARYVETQDKADPVFLTQCRLNLGAALTGAAEFTDAVTVLTDAVRMSSELWGNDHQKTLMARQLHIDALAGIDDPSVPELQRQLEIDCTRALGPDHPVTLEAMRGWDLPT
ncbi:hypothetical protein DFJ66_2736 [Saccharothrix variisporea]|uniref:Novel STAND NTPase 3 domain-containing protein n=2 Tax=Saccharothrix variisporea TaxID=543527 RepID=A0A495X800_9PSEU|nr:hypothetical protein DFJ66_2736 [Saccharothrix variisporea]